MRFSQSLINLDAIKVTDDSSDSQSQAISYFVALDKEGYDVAAGTSQLLLESTFLNITSRDISTLLVEESRLLIENSEFLRNRALATNTSLVSTD